MWDTIDTSTLRKDGLALDLANRQAVGISLDPTHRLLTIARDGKAVAFIRRRDAQYVVVTPDLLHVELFGDTPDRVAMCAIGVHRYPLAVCSERLVQADLLARVVAATANP